MLQPQSAAVYNNLPSLCLPALPPKPVKPQQTSSVGMNGGTNSGAKEGGTGASLPEAEWYWGDISR